MGNIKRNLSIYAVILFVFIQVIAGIMLFVNAEGETNQEILKNPQFLVKVEGLNDTIVSGKAAGENALVVVKKVLDENNIQYTLSQEGIITEISGLSKNKAAGWSYYVKKTDKVLTPEIGLKEYIPEALDEIVLYYSNSTVPVLDSVTFSTDAENGGIKMKFLSQGLGIPGALAAIDEKNYVTDKNGEINIGSGLAKGTHTYKISGYTCGKLSTVVIADGSFFIDEKNVPSVNFKDPIPKPEINYDNEIKAAAEAVKSYSDPFAFVSLNKLQMAKNEQYIKDAYSKIKSNGISSFSNADIENLIFAVTSCGYTPYDFAGCSLPAALYNRNIDTFKTDDLILGLLAMNYANIQNTYNINRINLVQKLVEKEIIGENNTGWSLSDSMDPYITGAALCALAPYYYIENVKTAVDGAVKSLAFNENEEGYATGYYGITSETNAFVVMGLIASGVNPEGITTFDDGTNVNFAKSKGDLISALLSFKGDSGLYKHILQGTNNSAATEMCLRALISINEYKKSGYAYNYYISEIDSSQLKVYAAPVEEKPKSNADNNTNENVSTTAVPAEAKADTKKNGSKSAEIITDKKAVSKNTIHISLGGLILVIGAIGIASQALNRKE